MSGEFKWPNPVWRWHKRCGAASVVSALPYVPSRERGWAREVGSRNIAISCLWVPGGNLLFYCWHSTELPAGCVWLAMGVQDLKVAGPTSFHPNLCPSNVRILLLARLDHTAGGAQHAVAAGGGGIYHSRALIALMHLAICRHKQK